jgi:hypothetical protein
MRGGRPGEVMERSSRDGTPSVSVVVPALDEADRLPGLLDCLERQTLRPIEVVIADAGSSDGTAEVARSRGARVVAGGRPAAGRNAGARAASGDLILFLDADSRPPEGFIEMAVSEFVRRGLCVAGAPVEPIERRPDYVAACRAARLYLRAVQHVAPHAAGSCILVRRDVHERIGGFDETLALAEDHDYVRRASKCGTFRIFRGVSIPVSMRRVAQEGRLRLGLKYAYCEIRTLAGRPIRRIPFKYEFGAYPGARDDRLRAPRSLRRLARTLEQPSTEVQTDAIGIAITSVVGGGAGALALAAAGASPGAYIPVAGVALATAGLSAYEAARKLRYERHYGEFFMASLAVASADLVGDDGTLLAARGVDEIWELHAIDGLDRMSELNGQGREGRLTIMLETFEGLRDMLDDEEIALHTGARLVTARSDLVTLLFKLGFDEISNPPPYDVLNRINKRLLAGFLDRRMRRDGSAGLGGIRMAVMPTERFFGQEFRAVLDAQISRIAAGLERSRSRSKRASV